MKRRCGVILAFMLAVLCLPTHAIYSLTVFANAATSTGIQTAVSSASAYSQTSGHRTVSCAMTVSSGSGSATVVIEGSLDPAATSFVTIMTLTVTDTAADAGTDTGSRFAVYRARITAISGTGAAVTCYGGT